MRLRYRYHVYVHNILGNMVLVHSTNDYATARIHAFIMGKGY